MTYFYVNQGCKCSSHVPYNGNWLKNSKVAKNNVTSFLNSHTVSVNVKCTINCKHNTINGLGLFSSYHLRQNYRWYHLLLMNENLDRVIRSNKIRMTKCVWQTMFFSLILSIQHQIQQPGITAAARRYLGVDTIIWILVPLAFPNR